MTQCSTTLMVMAATSHMLVQGGMVSRLWSSLSAFRALNISTATMTDRDSVEALALPASRQAHGS